jgi:AcrR family transcriptional regulator
MSPEQDRRLRADAQLNHDRLLEAAARAFARDGGEATLKAIAKDAGVGIGTLYRRFPTREALVEATYRNEVESLCGEVPDLLRTQPAAEALRVWMQRFVEFFASAVGMSDTLRAVLLNAGDLRMQTKDLIKEALSQLLAAAAAEDILLPDIDVMDVLMSLGGIALVAGDPDLSDRATRLIDILLNGIKRRNDLSEPTADAEIANQGSYQ